MKPYIIKKLGKKFTTNAKIRLVKFSLLNIETILKGIPNTEVRKESKIKKLKIEGSLSSEATKNKKTDIAKNIVIIKAVENDIFVNILRDCLANIVTSPYKKNHELKFD